MSICDKGKNLVYQVGGFFFSLSSPFLFPFTVQEVKKKAKQRRRGGEGEEEEEEQGVLFSSSGGDK